VLDSIAPDGRGGWTVAVPDDWMQGRSIFGGLQAAIALRAMRPIVSGEAPLRVLQVAFVAPIGGSVNARAEILRSGKSATHAEVRLYDGASLTAIVVGVFGFRRPSRIEIVPEQVAAPSTHPVDFVYADYEGFAPKFTQHFSMRWLRGGLPFSGSPVRDAVIEVGLNDSAPTSEAHVLAIADSPPPVALSMLESFAAGSSLTWTIEFLRDRVTDLPLTGWRLDAGVTAGRDGYTSQSVMVWGPRGEPVALSRQSMVIFG
jgi:acyl-CoA thioesterase